MWLGAALLRAIIGVRTYIAAEVAYTLKALTGAFYFFNDFPIRLKRNPIPGTIERSNFQIKTIDISLL